jgi:uncharacterized membrane protein
MQAILAHRKPAVTPTDRIGLADVGRAVLWAFVGAVGGMACGAIYASLVTVLFGAIAGAVAGMIVNEMRRDRLTLSPLPRSGGERKE